MRNRDTGEDMTNDAQREHREPIASTSDASANPPSFAPASKTERARIGAEALAEERRVERIAKRARRRSAPLAALRRLRPASLRTALSVLVVTTASGLLFTISAQTSRNASASADSGLVSLVRSSQADVAALDSQVSGLRKEVDSYAHSGGAEAPTTVPALAASPVSGPGVTITLTDANLDAVPEGATANDLVIHQQDIEDVMNALWNGGAEAMTVQGVRVTGRTVIRCIGNVILVDGDSFSPPYVLQAIGDPDELRAKVDANPRIVNYKAYVRLYGLGWSMTSDERLDLPAASAKTTNSYAQVVN